MWHLPGRSSGIQSRQGQAPEDRPPRRPLYPQRPRAGESSSASCQELRRRRRRSDSRCPHLGPGPACSQAPAGFRVEQTAPTSPAHGVEAGLFWVLGCQSRDPSLPETPSKGNVEPCGARSEQEGGGHSSCGQWPWRLSGTFLPSQLSGVAATCLSKCESHGGGAGA